MTHPLKKFEWWQKEESSKIISDNIHFYSTKMYIFYNIVFSSEISIVLAPPG